MTSSISLIAVAFLIGFVLAALAFWPKRRQAPRSGRAPKHALGSRGRAPEKEETPEESPEEAAQPPAPETPEPAEAPATDPPIIVKQEFVEIPTLPTGLFEQRYRPKFDRTRRRLERLRAHVEQL